MSKDVKFNINLSVNGKDVVVQCKQGVQELGKALGTIPGKAEQSRQAMIKWSAVSTIYNNLYNGLQQLTGAMQPFIAKSNAATEAQTKLTTVMRQRMHATEADTEAVNKAISAQTKLGVVGGTVQRSGLQQLATFASQRSTLLTLLPAMNNLVVQQRGLGATGEDAVGIANLMGKALMGNATAMRRVGITLSDSQAEMIKYGNESERAKAIAEAITDNVGNMNAEMAKTDAGKAKQLANTFGGLQVKVGRFFSEYQSYIASIGQIGMAVTAIGTVSSALRGLIGRLGLVTLATSSFRVVVSGLKSVLAAARIATVEMAVAEQLEGKGALAAAVSTTIFKTAIRGLMIATGVGAAIALLTMGIEALVNWLDNSSDSSEEAAAGMKKTVTAAEQAKSRMGDLAANGAAPLISKYEELRKKWQALTDDKKRLKFISDSANAFHSLGVRIGSVSEAEDFLVKSTDKVRQALYARAEAAAAAQVAQEEYEKALRADIAAKDEESKARQRSLEKADGADANTRFRVRGAKNAMTAHEYSEGIRNGKIKVTSARSYKARQDAAQHRRTAQSLQDYSEQKSRQASKGLAKYSGGKQYHASTDTGTHTGHASTSGGKGSASTDKKALRGSLDWYDQQMSALRKKIYATNDANVAEGLQKQYKELEKKSKDLKVKVGIEKPDNEVKSYVEQLQDKLKEAQKQMDNATTVEARVAASAKVDDLQHQIDVVTKGEVTISAEVEPSYIVKGSETDKLQSYHNAQNNGQNVRSLMDAGIIDEAEAKRRIENINKQLKELGVKPITIELKKASIDQAKESVKELTQSFGGNQLGTNIMQVVKAFKDVGKAAKEAKTGTTDSGKSFNATGNYAAAAGAGLATMGQALGQLGGQGDAAKAGAVMAAIGQIVLGFATYTAKSAELGPWGWVAAVASGLGIVASTIATLKGYATGGVLTGPTSSGDKLLFRGNAGEMVFNTAQQRRLYAIANGNYLPRLPRMQAVRPQVGAIGDASQVMTINVRGKLKGNDMELMGSNTRSLGAKIGKRY